MVTGPVPRTFTSTMGTPHTRSIAVLMGVGMVIAGVGMFSGRRISKDEELPKSIGGHAEATQFGFNTTDRGMSSTEIRHEVHGHRPRQ